MKFLLFDLGGVLVDMPGVAKMIEWTGLEERECWAQWMKSPAIAQFESGKLDAQTFAEAVVAGFQLPVSPKEFLLEFATWPSGFYPGAQAFLAELRASHQLGCLTNINSIHWKKAVEEWKVYDYFDHCLASHELGLVKPNPMIFEQAARIVGREPSDILYFDDNLVNVQAAASFGFSSHQVRGLRELRDLMKRLTEII